MIKNLLLILIFYIPVITTYGQLSRLNTSGSTIILTGRFSIESLSTIQRLMTQFTIPMASTTYGQSLDIVSGFYSEK